MCHVKSNGSQLPKQRAFMSYVCRNADEALRGQNICGGVQRSQCRCCFGDDILSSARKPTCMRVSPRAPLESSLLNIDMQHQVTVCCCC